MYLIFVDPCVLFGAIPEELEVEPARRPPPRAVLDHHSAAALDLPRLLEQVQGHIAAHQFHDARDEVTLCMREEYSLDLGPSRHVVGTLGREAR